MPNFHHIQVSNIVLNKVRLSILLQTRLTQMPLWAVLLYCDKYSCLWSTPFSNHDAPSMRENVDESGRVLELGQMGKMVKHESLRSRFPEETL